MSTPRGEPRVGAGHRPLAVLVAPDSFKGSLTSLDVADALSAGWRRGRPRDEILLAPLADGGEGTLVAIEAAGGWERRTCRVTDPLGRPRDASWLRSADGRRAAVELAQASGVSRVAAGDRDAGRATTFGTGELLRAALDAGIREIVLGIGGSATSDGGAGILEALGARFLDAGGRTLGRGGLELGRLDRVDLSGLDARLAELDLRIACDVTNPLLGPNGAAATYGPQKGAGPAEVHRLDDALGRFADVLETTTGSVERETPGAGAAGGTAFGLLCLRGRFRSLELVPGVDLVMETIGFDVLLAGASLVLTGEGRIDAQTAFGKTARGVAVRARDAGLPCIAFGGGVEPEGIDALASVGAIVVPVTERPMTVDEAMAAGSAPLERAAERIARLAEIGMALEPARNGECAPATRS